jgi:hypothetical protein
VAQLGRGQPQPAVISRGSFADAPVLTTRAPVVAQAAATPRYGAANLPVISQAPQAPAIIASATPAPLVVAAAVPQLQPARAVVTRGAIQDPADLAGRKPLIVAASSPQFGKPSPALISASPAAPAAAPSASAPAPLVAWQQPPAVMPAAAVLSRNSLADAPVLTTPPPVIEGPAATPGFGRAQPAVISSAPLIATAAPAQATPGPVVVSAQPPRVPPGPAVVSRNSLADAPVLTTPAPVVVLATAVTPWGRPQAAVISSGPAAPAAAAAQVTPAPVVVALAVKLAAARPPVILRNTLADAPVLTTPRPVIVAAPNRWLPTFPVISSSPPPGPPVLYGTARHAVMPVPAAVAGGTSTGAARAVAGTATAAAAVAGDASQETARAVAGAMTIPSAEGGRFP